MRASAYEYACTRSRITHGTDAHTEQMHTRNRCTHGTDAHTARMHTRHGCTHGTDARHEKNARKHGFCKLRNSNLKFYLVIDCKKTCFFAFLTEKKDTKVLTAKKDFLHLQCSNEQTKRFLKFCNKRAVGEPRQNGVLTFNFSSMEQTKVLLEIIYLFVSIVSVVLSLTDNGKRK